MKPARVRPGVLFYGVAILVIAASLAVLFQLMRRFEADLETNLESLQRVFSNTRVLATPSDRRIRFASIEELAEKYDEHPYFGPITVTKLFGSTERVVHPFYFPAFYQDSGSVLPEWGDLSKVKDLPSDLRTHPLPWAKAPNTRKLVLSVNGIDLGNLYVTMKPGPLATVRAVIVSLSLLLVGALALLAMQFRRQEYVISRTTVELEEKRRELMRLERLALAGQLSANILHDLRKPVLNIRHEIEEPTDAEAAPVPDAAGRRIRDQVDLFFGILRDSNLERFVRGEGEREFVDVNELLERSLALVRYERGNVVVTRTLGTDVPPVLAEPVRLVQVFSNLIMNAYQAMEGKGALDVTSTLREGRVVIEIADTGPGIPADKMDEVFTPFFSTKPLASGTGLGLYITRDIVSDLGGRIAVESSPKGTTFRIELPTEAGA